MEDGAKPWAVAGPKSNMSRDPDFQEIAKAEQSEKTLEKADIMWLEPTDSLPQGRTTGEPTQILHCLGG